MKGWDQAAVKHLEDQGRVRGVPALVRPPLVVVTARPVVERRERAPNTWEAAYAREVLEPRRAAGEIARYDFEAASFRLGRGRYTPDWIAQFVDGRLEAHEVKGFMREAARVRLGWFAERFPAVALFVARGGPGKWTIERRKA